MAEPYLSEIRMMSFKFAPRGWAFCDGQRLAIAQNQALFALLGTTYGGDGTTFFNLPDLRGRVPMHRGPQTPLGATGGEEAHVLTTQEVPGPHSHFAYAAAAPAETPTPAGNSLAQQLVYRSPEGATPTTLLPESITPVGGSPHDNMQPYLPVNFCIALAGVFPTRD